MNKEDIQKALEAISKSGVAVAGDLVIEKHVDYEVNNVEAGGIGIQVINGEVHETSEIHTGDEEDKILPSWEEVIPEWLRTGKLLIAWNELRRDGVLREDYQLKEKKAAVAYRLVEGFHQAWEELTGRKGNKPWRYFEDFWGFENLKTRGGSISKESETAITKIFREL